MYAYAYVNLLKNVTATLGLSFDSLSGDEDVNKDQVNPKFGITWTPFAGTTLRAAVFRVLKRTLITDQTLEPTQVAGFNQFFDDVHLTEAWRYGGAIDQKFTKSLFGGVEFSKRDLTVPIPGRDGSLQPGEPGSGLERVSGPCVPVLDTASMAGAQSGVHLRALQAG